MKLRGITHPSAFLLRNGFTRSESSRIAVEKIKALSPSQIERLCKVLRCIPNDLFCWTPDAKEINPETQTLWKIRCQEQKSITDIGKEIPAEKMSEFLAKVKEVEEKFKTQ